MSKRSITDKLLRESIADAKLISDTAIANARIQMEEAFKPQLASVLSAKLRDAAGVINEQNVADSSDIGKGLTVDNPAPKEPSKAASDSTDIEDPGIEVDTFDDNSSTKPKAVNENDLPSPDDEFGGGADMGVSPETDDMFGGDEFGGDEFGGEEESVDELDLEAIIQQLEADVMNGADSAPLPQEELPTEGFDDPMAGAKVNGPITVRRETVNVAEKDANSASKDGVAQKQVDGVNGGKEVKAGQEVADHEMLEALDLDEILREVEAEEARDKSEITSEVIAAENVELKTRLREHREVVVYLREQLNKLNVLNSKLLYTNRLFRGFDLDMGNKKRVVETFDRATTLREVKLVYMTLAESLAVKSGNRAKTKKSVVEGLSSKPVASTRSLTEQKAPVDTSSDEDAFRQRMQKLAGINRNIL